MSKTIKPAQPRPASGKQIQTQARVLGRFSFARNEPLYKQLVRSLRDDILRGVFPVGSQLPTEEVLAERFAVSRHTVREALRQLRADQLVSSRQGSGTTVMPAPPSTPFNVHRVASIDELIAYAVESHYAIERTNVVASENIADAELELPLGHRWLHLQGLRFSPNPSEPPICWTEVFVASEYAGVERLLGRLREGPVWRLIEDMYGERLVEVEQTLRVRPTPAAIAAGLQVEPDSAAVEVRRTYKTAAGKIAEISVNLYPGEKFRFSMKLRRA